MSMTDLRNRPLQFFNQGERIRLVDINDMNPWRLKHGIELGKEYTVKYCFRRTKRGRKEIKVMLEGYQDWLFSTRRFERIADEHFEDELFTL